MPSTFFHAMPFGARYEEGGVRFRVWAPARDGLALLLETSRGEQSLPMQPIGGGWFELTTDAAGPGSRYRYRLDNGLAVPDPASRFQPDDVHVASEVIDPCAYQWRQFEWRGRPWCETVLYETHVGAFTPDEDYDGVRRKLDYLADTGITAVELMPLSAFEGRRNWGYDGVLPFAPDAQYGSPKQLKKLIDTAHERGLMMFLDVVYNHFGPSGNYLAQYAPTFFTDRYHTPWGDAIDFTRREVRQFFIHNALYWLEEYRFDGLRLDAVDQIVDPSKTHILVELARAVRQAFPRRHVHLVLENDDNAVSYLGSSLHPPLYNAQWNDDFHHAAHVIATGENSGYYIDYANEPIHALGRALAEGFIYQGEFSKFRNRPRGDSSADLHSSAFVNFIQNHDQIGNRAFGERLGMLAEPEIVEALTAIVLLAPQIPLLFMGEEWGAPQPFNYFCDYRGELADAVREGRRKEFSSFATFSDPAARERIPDPNADSTFTNSRLDWAAAEALPAQRRLARIQKLLDMRRREIVPRLPAFEGRHEVEQSVLRVIWRLDDDSRLHLVANLSRRTKHGLEWSPRASLLFASPSYQRRLVSSPIHSRPKAAHKPNFESQLPPDSTELLPWTVIWTHEP